jgi:hypothetical protein
LLLPQEFGGEDIDPITYCCVPQISLHGMTIFPSAGADKMAQQRKLICGTGY